MLLTANHSKRRLAQQERTTTICKRELRINQTRRVEVELRGDKQLASNKPTPAPVVRDQTYVAGILDGGVVDGSVGGELKKENGLSKGTEWGLSVRTFSKAGGEKEKQDSAGAVSGWSQQKIHFPLNFCGRLGWHEHVCSPCTFTGPHAFFDQTHCRAETQLRFVILICSSTKRINCQRPPPPPPTTQNGPSQEDHPPCPGEHLPRPPSP